MKAAWTWIAVAAAALLAGCASERGAAPVIDRTSRVAAPKPSVRSAAKPAAPAAATPAPPAAATPAAPAAPDGYYVVKRGDTLYSIALDHGVDYRELAQWNQLDDPTRIRVGQPLRVKPDEAQGGVTIGRASIGSAVEARPLEGPSPAPLALPSAPPGAVPAVVAPATPKSAPAKESTAKEAPAAAAAATEFMWPVKGKILSGFAEPRSKGIDIDGKLGEPVLAAAAGRVTYIGSGIPGLGKLVVIKHDNGFITVYAHNRAIVVKEQQSVTRGQKIAELGASDSDRPKLHFQIRKGSAAVDPLRYLPAL